MAWVNWQKRWMNKYRRRIPGLPVLQVSYENFVKNPVEEVKTHIGIYSFRGNEERIQCVVQTKLQGGMPCRQELD